MRRLHFSWRGAATAVAALIVGTWLVFLVRVIAWSQRDETPLSDAVVVLGAAQYDGRPSPVLKARLDHGIDLWKAGRAPELVLTGGRGIGDTTSEAAVGRRYAMKRGVPASAIQVEEHGRTTSESLIAVAELLHTRGGMRAIFVSDPFHMLRLRILARRFGMQPATSPTPTSPIWQNPLQRWGYILAESVKTPLAFFFERRS